jgi:DNA polymerase sigma
MFGLFKKKTEREKLLEIYKKKKEEAFNLSKINRTESDKLEQEAYEISKKIDLLDKEKNNA